MRELDDSFPISGAFDLFWMIHWLGGGGVQTDILDSFWKKRLDYLMNYTNADCIGNSLRRHFLMMRDPVSPIRQDNGQAESDAAEAPKRSCFEMKAAMWLA